MWWRIYDYRVGEAVVNALKRRTVPDANASGNLWYSQIEFTNDNTRDIGVCLFYSLTTKIMSTHWWIAYEIGEMHTDIVEHTWWLDSAICVKPTAKLLSLAGVSDSLESSGFARPDFLASAKSRPFASSTCACLETSNSANLWTLDARSSGVSACSWRLPMRAGID